MREAGGGASEEVKGGAGNREGYGSEEGGRMGCMASLARQAWLATPVSRPATCPPAHARHRPGANTNAKIFAHELSNPTNPTKKRQ